MDPVWPENTPEGLAFTPAFALKPETQITFLGLITPERNGVVHPSISQQTLACLLNLADGLAALESGAKAIKVTRLMRDVREVWTSQHEFDKYFGDIGPASTLIEVPACSHPNARIELEVWAAANPARPQDGRELGYDGLPHAVTAKCQSTFSFVNGAAGGAVGNGVVTELNTCLDTISDNLSATGGSTDDIVKLTLYLADMRFWPACREAIVLRYGSLAPVVVPIAVNKVQQEGASIEALATFCIPSARVKDAAVAAQATLGGSLLVMSGAAALPIYVGGKAHDAYGYEPEPSAAAQTRISLGNLEKVLKSAGANWSDVFKTTWYVSDLREWPLIRDAALGVLGRLPPNPSVIEVSKLVLPAVRVEADIWAIKH
ncbi:hypothetical protein K469DRAFT_703124 [Zopfia rhizophila CBS 207.26]|uniref:YjgF-like protein n=1 Tax=Zopfia rhizophila CBS 207.26 TaxID=1314779 RepID=A0A6A6EBJ4_9PEZI|nr:hypothetical protein K469DRAFT_703124 [Zopfia rhizophila CBS 207.26]